MIKEIAKMAGVNVIWHYNVTTIDPPELVRFIRREHPDVIFERPKNNFFRRMEERNGFPTRVVRWCCGEFKESRTPDDSTIILGVRASESGRRAKNWRAFARYRNGWAIAPILTWNDYDVWDFIKSNNVPYCKLYDEGFTRLGCIGCPMGEMAQRVKQFQRWPRFEALWRRSFRRIWERKHGTMQRGGKVWWGDRQGFKNGEEMFEWWLSDLPSPENVECYTDGLFT